MRVAIDLTPAVQGHAGLGRYAQELASALVSSCPPDEELAVFYNDPARRRPVAPLDCLPAATLAWNNKPWRMSVLLAQAARWPQDATIGHPDIFLATDHLLPYSRRMASVFTLHDLIFRHFPEAHLPLNRWFLSLMVPRFLRNADAIIAVSECSKRDAINLYGVRQDKIRVVYEAAGSHFRPVVDATRLADIRQRYTLPERFLLYVGTIEPRKNLPLLFEAYKAAQLNGVRLVIAGKRGWLYEDTFARLQALGIEQDVCFTGFVADEDLPGLYSLAEAFVFPSLYEGFGLPVLEAMSCASPVLCSDASSLPEVAGDAAVLLPPSDPRAWKDALVRVTSDPALRADLRSRGLRRAAGFSWERAAAETRELYRDVYARRH